MKIITQYFKRGNLLASIDGILLVIDGGGAIFSLHFVFVTSSKTECRISSARS